MSKRRTILSADHARALVEEAIGRTEGAAIDASHASGDPTQTRQPSTKPGMTNSPRP